MARKPNAAPPTIKVANDDIERDDELPVVVDEEIDAATDPIAEAAAEPAKGNAEDESSQSLAEQLAAANARAEAAERRAAEAQTRVSRQGDDLLATQRAVVDRALEAETAAKADIRRQIVEAKQAGNYEAETELLDKLSEVNLKLTRLTEGKNELERLSEEAKERASADPIDLYTRNMKPEAKRWVRDHAEYVTDPALNKKLERAHYAALGDGLDAGTPEYFGFLETKLGLREAERAEPATERRAAPAVERRTPAAPVSRGASQREMNLPTGVTVDSNGNYHLSAAHREAARISGVSNATYLQNMLTLKREGAIN